MNTAGMDISKNSNYSYVEVEDTLLYYGYEETVGQDDNEEWCFVYKKKGKEITRYTTSELEHLVDDGVPSSYLLAGLCMLISEGLI